MKRLLLILGFLPSFIFAQGPRKYVNEFLYIGAGARQFGMGKTGVASTDDVYSAYWNPAGLSQMNDKLQVGFMHNFYFQNIANFDYLAIASKSGENRAFAFSMLRFGVDGILNTLDLIRNGEIDYNRVTEFSAVDYAFMGSYSERKRLVRNYNAVLGWGSTVKLIHRRVGEFARAWGFGVDVGLRLQDYKDNWGLSVNFRDITTTFNSWSFSFTNSQKDILYLTGNTIPESSLEVALPRMSTGGFYRWHNDKFEARGEMNIDFTSDGRRNTLFRTGLISGDFRLGVEGGIRNEEKKYKLLLRTGLYNFQREVRQNGKSGLTVQPTAGFGIEYDRLRVDYALAGFGAGGTGLYSNIISLAIGVNKGK
jgi:hypothetical protein